MTDSENDSDLSKQVIHRAIITDGLTYLPVLKRSSARDSHYACIYNIADFSILLILRLVWAAIKAKKLLLLVIQKPLS